MQEAPMRIVPGFVIRQIAGEVIAVPAGPAAHRLSGLVALNETGHFLFELLQTEQTEGSLLQAMLEEYDIDEDTARADIGEFLQLLRTNQMLDEGAEA